MSDLGVLPWVRAMLVCPKCRGELTERVEAGDGGITGYLDCAACALAYPVVNGTPWLVIEHAVRR